MGAGQLGHLETVLPQLKGASISQPKPVLQASDPEWPGLLPFQTSLTSYFLCETSRFVNWPAHAKFKTTNYKILEHIGSKHCFLNNTPACPMWLMCCEFASPALKLGLFL